MNKKLSDIKDKVYRNERLSFEDGVELFNCYDVHYLGEITNYVREKKHSNRAYYITNAHLNYSNICAEYCSFCAFGKRRSDKDAYELSIDEILRRVDGLSSRGISELHIVGGNHPTLPYEFYRQVLVRVKEKYPNLHLKAYTAIEIEHLVRMTKKSYEEILRDLKGCGLDSLPGGGAEIFAEDVRKQICPTKASTEEWLRIHETAHRLNIKSTATMLYGHIEKLEDRVDHILKLRELQDRTGGFTAFVPLSFHPKNTELSHLPPPTGFDDLRTIAIARLLLDNFKHIKAYWVMLGIKLAQVALYYGADDIDGTIVEEKVTHMAGASSPVGLTENELVRYIKESGRVPVRRDSVYSHFVVTT